MMYSKNPERRSPPGKTCYLIVRGLCYHVPAINAIRLHFPHRYLPHGYNCLDHEEILSPRLGKVSEMCLRIHCLPFLYFQ